MVVITSTYMWKITVNIVAVFAIYDTQTEQLVLLIDDDKNKPLLKEFVLVTRYQFGDANTETTLRYVVYLS